MEKGDISGQPTPRLLFVFEGLVAHRGEAPLQRIVGALTRRFSALAVQQWNIDPVMRQQFWDLFWRHNMRLDVVTFMGDEFAVALYRRFQDLDLPVSNVLSFESPAALASAIAYMPDVAAVYDGDPSRKLAFGSKGRYVSDPSQSLLN